MNFYWFDLLQVVVGLSIVYLVYVLYQAKRKRTALFVAAVGFLFVVLAPVNMTKQGFNSIESRNTTLESDPLPERVTVPPQPSFEERVKEDIKKYEEERKDANN